jgi:hypothetical protein
MYLLRNILKYIIPQGIYILYKILKYDKFNIIKMHYKIYFNKNHKIPLTKSEKYKINKLWGKVDKSFYESMKAIMPFDPNYCSEKYFQNIIHPVLFPKYLSPYVNNKNLYDLLYEDNELKFPQTILKNIRGVYFDKNMVVINEKTAIDILFSMTEVIIKPCINTGCGRNIKKVLISDEVFIKKLLSEYKKDFIIQKVVEQHPLLADFNESSMNNFRINTFFINGNITVCSRSFTWGKKGSVISHGGILGFTRIPLNEKGNSLKIAFAFKDVNAKPNKYKLQNEVNFPFYTEIENLAVTKHIKYFPQIGLLAWDFTFAKVDDNYIPMCIEIERVYTIINTQVWKGPYFGDRTEEVIKYVNKNNKR